MKKLLLLGAAGVVILVAGVVLITSGIGAGIGQVFGIVGVALIVISVVGFPFAARWALFRTKGRAVFFGARIVGRVVKFLAILLVAGIAVAVFLTI